MVCPRCQSENCQIINVVTETGKDFYASKGILGAICFGPIGILCGACGKGRKVRNKQYWVCNRCGKKWKL